MDDENLSGVFSKVRKLVSLGTGRAKTTLSGMNLPYRLACCDCAWKELFPQFKSRIFIRDHAKRAEYYETLAQMIRDILSSLQHIRSEAEKNAPVPEDSSVPVLVSVLKSFEMLRNTAVLAATISTNFQRVEYFAGADVVPKLRQIEDSTTDIEMEYLYTLADLIESAMPAMLKNAEQRKRALSKSELQRYDHACMEISEKYKNQFKPFLS